MGIREITAEAVLKAVAEHDRLGADAFRERYGFGPARTYSLVHNGKEYDSKAIVGVAHGHLPGRSPLNAEDFSGGQVTVVRLLRSLGFEVRDAQQPRQLSWLEAELVLACDLLMRNDWKHVRANDPRAAELSELLRSLPLHRMEWRHHNFRNPNSVQHKTYDIEVLLPHYHGKPKKGGELDRKVLQAFLDRPDEMRAEAEAIRAGVRTGEWEDLPVPPDLDEEEATREGRLLLRRHLARERDPKLRAKKIEAALAEHSCLACEVCEFDFERVYGDRGKRYAEVHHKTPLHVSGPTSTRLRDLAVLCANCHRMIHRGTRWLTPDELRELVRDRRGARED
ncbi:HNH endonuclease [Lentzea sp. NPDC060358]|uniref:HNH endonuclease n=1 Tax=Lentzea sp. NPDC060358 TaxID=3347103 RepID=UPI0036564436